MAEMVLGLASSHGPQVSIPGTQWDLLRRKDETDPRLDYAALAKRAPSDIARELAPERWVERSEATQRAVARLGEVLRAAAPDAVVIVGDDQHEQFLDDNLPALAVYHGRSFWVAGKHEGTASDWKRAEQALWAPTASEYHTATGLAEHLIRSLIEDEFDVARSDRLRDGVGIGHAFSFLYRRLWPGGTVPIVPVLLNTYYPPNQPTPRRCYRLGQSLRRAIGSWEGAGRVAVLASGGLSHVVVDEELDREALDAMARKDERRLHGLPREKLRGGTSEILSWVTVAGAVEPLSMQLVEYLPAYRSPAGTGCGLAFAYWS